jgi:hypothetical protein
LPSGFFGILHCVQDDGKNLQKQRQCLGWRRIYFSSHRKVRDGAPALVVSEGKNVKSNR